MKTLLTVMILSALSLTACSKQVSQSAVSQELKHGYELAKTWDDATVKVKTAEAADYYGGAIGLARAGGFRAGAIQTEMDWNTYRLCVNRAQNEKLCKLTDTATKAACADRVELGPQHIAECNKLIDELPKLIEERNAAWKAELKK